MWLMATTLGMGLHIASQLGDEPIESEIKKVLNISAYLLIALG